MKNVVGTITCCSETSIVWLQNFEMFGRVFLGFSFNLRNGILTLAEIKNRMTDRMRRRRRTTHKGVLDSAELSLKFA